MMRLLFLLVLTLPFAACGSGSSLQRPAAPAPSAGRRGPPPAWIETRRGNRWLGYSSYCWTHSGLQRHTLGLCADFLAPKCSQKSVPKLRVDAGEQVRAHLGYTPTEASVEGARARLEGRVVEWHVLGGGPFLLLTKGTDGDASYTACGVLR
jgi:hypothetical protein